MKFPANMRGKKRIARLFITAIAFLAPAIAAPSSLRADEGTISDDTRMESYQNAKMELDTGVATDYLLFGVLILLALGVMFKDARRTHRKD